MSPVQNRRVIDVYIISSIEELVLARYLPTPAPDSLFPKPLEGKGIRGGNVVWDVLVGLFRRRITRLHFWNATRIYFGYTFKYHHEYIYKVNLFDLLQSSLSGLVAHIMLIAFFVK